MATIEGLINSPASTVFRRLEIKRRLTTTGLYESTWQDISQYVKTWGNVERSIDETRLNRFRNSGLTVKLRNDTGAFNLEGNANSLWFGYMTRHNTLIRVSSGYEDAAGTEYPTDPVQGVFIMDQEMSIEGDTNDVVMNCSSLQSVFSNMPATEVGGLTSATLTAGDIVARVRDHSDGSSNAIFQQFISASVWSIQTGTANFYNLTTTSLDGLSVWDLMTKVAESESFILLINRTGGLDFRDRTARTTASQFSFYGQGFNNQNIVRVGSYREAVDKFYTRFRFKWGELDTTTSYVVAGTTTAVSASNLGWKYGSRQYDFQNEFVLTSTIAQTIVNNMFSALGSIGAEAVVKTKYVPQLEVLDPVDVSYHSYDMAGLSLWDVAIWDTDLWAPEGENFDWDGLTFKVLSVRHNLDQFSSELTLRRT